MKFSKWNIRGRVDIILIKIEIIDCRKDVDEKIKSLIN